VPWFPFEHLAVHPLKVSTRRSEKRPRGGEHGERIRITGPQLHRASQQLDGRFNRSLTNLQFRVPQEAIMVRMLAGSRALEMLARSVEVALTLQELGESPVRPRVTRRYVERFVI
jgi:hypothetical protein